MIYWALMFLLVAFIAAVFGFTGISAQNRSLRRQ